MEHAPSKHHELLLSIHDLPVPIILYDKESLTIRDWNISACELFNYKPAARPSLKAIRPFDGYVDKNILHTNDEFLSRIIAHQTSEGDEKFLEVTRKEVSMHGEPCYLELLTDQTLQIQIRQTNLNFYNSLTSTNANLSETLVFGKMGSATLNLNTSQLTISKELLMLLDEIADEPVSLPLEQFLTNYISPQFIETIHQKIKEGLDGLNETKREVDVSFEMITAKGRKIWISCKGIFKGDTALGILHDVTDRKLAQQRIAESELKNRLIIENSGEGILFTNPEGKIFSANPEACKIFGMTEKEICSTHSDGLADPASSGLRVFLDKKLADGFYHGEVQMKRKGGALFTAEITSRLFVNPDGNLNASVILRDISSRKQAESEVKKLALIARHTSNAVILTDVDGKITWVNDSFERVTEYMRDEVIGKTPSGLLQGRDSSLETIANMHNAIRQGIGFKVEILNYTKSKRKYWVDIEVMPIRNDDGVLTGFMAIESDITNMKIAVQEMQRSEQALQTFMDHAPMMAFVKDLKGRYTFNNKMYEEAIKTKTLHSGYTDYDLFDQKLAEKSAMHDRLVVDTGDTLHFEKHIDGKTFLEYKFPLRDAYNTIFAVGGICLDVTEKLNAQRLATESEERLRNLADNLPDGVVFKYLVDELGNFVGFPYVSSGSYNLLGYSSDEIQLNPSLVFDQIDNTMLQSMLIASETSRRTLGSFEFEYRIVTPKGDCKWLQTRSRPKRLDNGHTEWGGIMLDITERKKSEQALLASNDEKDALIKEIHHRVKNNLQLISSMLYIKMVGMKKSIMKDFLEDTRQKIRTIALIHERFLQTGSVNVVDISDYLGKLVNDLQMSNTRQDLNIAIDCAIEPEMMGLDAAIYYGLIITELVTNAIKHAFTSRVHGRIHIGIKQVEKYHQMIVSDDGCSLPDDIAPGQNGSFGMQLLDIFTKQLNGEVSINRNQGTAFHFIFRP